MNDKEKNKFVNDIKRASEDKGTWEAVKLEETLDDRIAWIEACAREDEREKSLAKGLEQGITEGLEQGREEAKDDMIKSMLKKKMDYNLISDITGKSIDYIKSIETNN